jgi:hypothetical protein
MLYTGYFEVIERVSQVRGGEGGTKTDLGSPGREWGGCSGLKKQIKKGKQQ